MFDRILVPLDGSELAEAVLTQVRRLLFRKDAEVILVQAVSVPPGIEADVGRVLETLRAGAAAYVAGVEGRLAAQGARVRSLVRVGGAGEVILRAAEEERAGLIAMSTHGRSGIARWVLGSVAEKVVRASPVPVLAVRSFSGTGREAAPTGDRELAFKRILVPIDASNLSLEVVPAAAGLAGLFEATVLLLHVCEDHPQCAVAVPQMTEAHERFRKAGVAVEPLMKKGDPAVQILEACRETSADLIALSTHGRSGLTRWVLGSVAEKVLRACGVPLLAVRPAKEAARPPAASGKGPGA